MRAFQVTNSIKAKAVGLSQRIHRQLSITSPRFGECLVNRSRVPSPKFPWPLTSGFTSDLRDLVPSLSPSDKAVQPRESSKRIVKAKSVNDGKQVVMEFADGTAFRFHTGWMKDSHPNLVGEDTYRKSAQTILENEQYRAEMLNLSSDGSFISVHFTTIGIKKEWLKSTLQTGCMPLRPLLEVLWTMPVTWPRLPACLILDHCWRTSTRTGNPGIPHWRFQNSVDQNCWRMRICKFNSLKPWWRQALQWSQILASHWASEMWIVANLWKTLCSPSLGESISILFEQHASVWSIQKQLLLKIPLTMIARTHSPCTQTTRTTTAHLATCSSCTKLVAPSHPKFAMAWLWRNISGNTIPRTLRCYPKSMWRTPSETVFMPRMVDTIESPTREATPLSWHILIRFCALMKMATCPRWFNLRQNVVSLLFHLRSMNRTWMLTRDGWLCWRRTDSSASLIGQSIPWWWWTIIVFCMVVQKSLLEWNAQWFLLMSWRPSMRTVTGSWSNDRRSRKALRLIISGWLACLIKFLPLWWIEVRTFHRWEIFFLIRTRPLWGFSPGQSDSMCFTFICGDVLNVTTSLVLNVGSSWRGCCSRCMAKFANPAWRGGCSSLGCEFPATHDITWGDQGERPGKAWASFPS